MIGIVRDLLARLDDLRHLEAVHPRHLDVEQYRREIVRENLLQRLRPGVGANQNLAERLEDRLEREKVLGAIVDEEEVDALVTHTAFLAPTFARSRLSSISLGANASSGSTSAVRNCFYGGNRHDRNLSRLRILHQSAPTPLHDVGKTARAIFVRSGEHDSNRPRSVRVRRRAEHHVDRWSAEPHRLLDGQRQIAVHRSVRDSSPERYGRCRAPAAPCLRPRTLSDRSRPEAAPTESRSESLPRCCTTTTGKLKSPGKAPSSFVIAARPPHDVPIPTTEYAIYLTFRKIFSGGAICW